MCNVLLQSEFNFAAIIEHIKDNVMETRQITRNYSGDVSNKIVGKDEVERLIADYGHKDSAVSSADMLSYLRTANVIAKVRIISFPMDGETRVDAIIHGFNTYSQFKADNYNRFAFCIEYSMNHPLLMDEEQRLRAFFHNICPSGSKAIVFSGIDSTLKDKVLVTIIASR